MVAPLVGAGGGLLGKVLSVGGPLATGIVGGLIAPGGALRTGPTQPAPATGANLPIPNYADFVQKMSKINYFLGLQGLPLYDIQEEYNNLVRTRELMNERYGERERALEAVSNQGLCLNLLLKKFYISLILPETGFKLNSLRLSDHDCFT